MPCYLEYFNGEKWIPCSNDYHHEHLAWLSLGDDNLNYRTVDINTGEVLTSKEVIEPEGT